MSTIPSTVDDFNTDFVKFHAAIGNRCHTADQIRGGFKALTLRYLGLQNVTQEEAEKCAMLLQIAIDGAAARGWKLT